ncbi:MAG: terminase small subunit [Candidatus Peribacteraceae bacterium]|jgi:hypothetical protein
MKGKVGRPTKYGSDIVASARRYVENCARTKEIPFIEELALQLGVDDDTIVEWAKKHDEFSATIKQLRLLQRLYLQKDSLSRKIHPTSAIFLLKANHGFMEAEKRQEANTVTTYEDLITAAEKDGEYAEWDIAEAINNQSLHSVPDALQKKIR